MTGAQSITLGTVEIIPVLELEFALPRDFAFPEADPQLWADQRDWLAPQFWDPAEDLLNVCARSWVLRSDGATIVVDTGIGNDRDRPGMPPFAQLNTDYLHNLAAAGVRPEDVDFVVTTHLHPDHVGWNTQLVNGQWAPTFPNARYLIARADFDWWNPVNANPVRIGPAMAGVFEDSVVPVHQAGLTELWEDGYTIDANLRLEPAPGHTPGSTVLWLRSGTDRAAFVGDLLHTPLQIVEPDLSPCLDEDENAGRTSRRRILDTIAEENALVLPAHFPGAGAAEIRRDGTRYAIVKWAVLD
ncbi:MAG TPA: MBL fold metallo-hydrolase [Pseudonocardia sp.]|jgi:glyoxylase-like metal-dependent hydrolase (beta-lactamase superfamily II)